MKKKPTSIYNIITSKYKLKYLNKIINKYNIIKNLNKKIKKIIPNIIYKQCKIININKHNIILETNNIHLKIYLLKNKNKIISKLKTNKIKYFYININQNLII